MRGYGHGDGAFLGLPRCGLQGVGQDIAEALREGVLPCPKEITDILSDLVLTPVDRR